MPSEAKLPPAITQINKIKRIYPDLYKREIRRTPTVWNHLRRMVLSRWYRQHHFWLATIYHYWNTTGDTYGTVQRTYEYLNLPTWKRATYNCIFKRESGFRATVWNGGALGWIQKYEGTNRVNGCAQLRPAWANGWLDRGAGRLLYGEDKATLRTYAVTSDPIASTRIAVRIGLQPFFAQAGACF